MSPVRRRVAARGGIAWLAAAALAGCQSLPSAAPLPAAASADRLVAATAPLEHVPFHPQRRHHCGPAALATVLGASGVQADPDVLADQVYVPGRRGSFQAELVAATRRAGRIPWVLDGSLVALADELAAGRPVLVLQNLGIPAWPRWHYAVVIEAGPGGVTLRSGDRRRRRMSTRAFLRTWDWGERWALVALRPGEWPARPEPRRWLETMSAFEQLGQGALAATGLADAVQRWPQDPLAWFALGNARYRAGNRDAAVTAWARATRLDPAFAAAWNNLAQGLADLGCREPAREALHRGLQVATAAADRRALESTARGLESGHAGAAAADQPVSSTASACSSASGRP